MFQWVCGCVRTGMTVIHHRSQDSVPAVLGLSSDRLVVYLAVLCAVLGLRSIYAITVAMVKSFHYLQRTRALATTNARWLFVCVWPSLLVVVSGHCGAWWLWNVAL